MHSIEPIPLNYPAPCRCWVKTEHGYSSKQWTVEDVEFAETAGAWFHPEAGHDFANMAARKAALGIL